MAERKVLITGGAGFLGRHAARLYAEKGWRVTGIGHGRLSKEEFGALGLYVWQEGDVTLENLLKLDDAFDVVVHAAGGGSVGFSIAEPLKDFDRTVASTAHVLEFIRTASRGARLVYLSSASVYGVAQRIPTPEDCPLRPVSPYGVHKMMAEDLIRSYGAHFNVSSVIVRFFSVYGPGLKKQLLWDSCKKALSGEPVFWGTGNEVRDWLHARDAAGLLFEAARTASADAPAVNGASGTGVTVRDALKEVFGLLGAKGEPRFNNETKPGDPLIYTADISRAGALGWKPAIGWKEGVREYVEWFKETAGR